MKRLLALITVSLLLGTGLLTGCQKASTAPQTATIDVVITDTSISPNGAKIEVRHGAEVTLKLTSSKHAMVHVHDYDASLTVEANQTASVTFTADKVGTFEIETHDPDSLVAQLVVTK